MANEHEEEFYFEFEGNDNDDAEEALEFGEILDGEDCHLFSDKIEFSQDENEEKQRTGKCLDAVSSVSEYWQVRKKHEENAPLRLKYAGKTKEELFFAMVSEGISSEERKWLKEEIFFQVFFLLPSVVKKNYRIAGHLFNDMMQNMSYAVLVAINKFDPAKGFKFTSYLAGYLKSGMTLTFRSSNVVSVPTGKRKILHEMQCTEEISPAEIVSYTGIEYDSNGSAGSHKINFEEHVHNKELEEWLEEAISKEAGLLSEDERMILILHYGLFGYDKKSYKEIAEAREKNGRSSSFSRISQIHGRAIEKLRQYFIERQIEEF